MVLFVAGASHTGKTALAQRLLEQYHRPYFSIDHLKMGLIRSGYTALTPADDAALTGLLWPIVREMAKTAVENRQNLIIEGCYIPPDWRKDFSAAYLPYLRDWWLVFSEEYIRQHFADIGRYANVVEQRAEDELSLEQLLRDNRETLELCRRHGCTVRLIDTEYDPVPDAL